MAPVDVPGAPRWGRDGLHNQAHVIGALQVKIAHKDRVRPVFFNLLRITFPVGAITSIGHRLSGIALVVCTPVLIYLLDASLRSATDFERVCVLLGTAPAKALALLTFWAFGHHLLAGVRHLLMDIDIGSGLPAARASAWLVNIAAIGLALLAGAILL